MTDMSIGLDSGVDHEFLNGFVSYAEKIFTYEYPDITRDGMDELLFKFFTIAMKEDTQEFIHKNFDLTGQEEDKPLYWYDILLWLDIGHDEARWHDNRPITDSIRDIDVDNLRWDEHIKIDDHGTVTSITSRAHCPKRRVDFGNDTENMKFYGYNFQKIYGVDAINNITIGSASGDLIQVVEEFTDFSRVNESGYLDRIGCNLLVAPSGITYRLVPAEFPAWYIPEGRHYDYDGINHTFHHIPRFNFNNQTVSIVLVNDHGFTGSQESVTTELCGTFVEYIHKRGDDSCYYDILSAAEVDYRFDGAGHTFKWENLADRGLINLSVPDISDYDSVMFEYNARVLYRDESVIALRYKLKEYGEPVKISGNEYIDSLYDYELARYAAAFKAKVLGRIAPEICYNESGQDLNWYSAAQEALDHILGTL